MTEDNFVSHEKSALEEATRFLPIARASAEACKKQAVVLAAQLNDLKENERLL